MKEFFIILIIFSESFHLRADLKRNFKTDFKLLCIILNLTNTDKKDQDKNSLQFGKFIFELFKFSSNIIRTFVLSYPLLCLLKAVQAAFLYLIIIKN